MSHLSISVSIGELIDKITILQIKNERISDPRKAENVRQELALLLQARDTSVGTSPELEALAAELRRVNETLWDIEDAIRRCERVHDFGPRFIELARAVYHNNDKRAVVKRQINDAFGSHLVEEKFYPSYPPRPSQFPVAVPGHGHDQG